jgi:hypothetical protein
MNKHPEQLARDKINQLLLVSGWIMSATGQKKSLSIVSCKSL